MRNDRFKDGLMIVAVIALVGVTGCGRAAPEQVEQAKPVQQPAPTAAGHFEVKLETGGPLKMTAAPLEVTVREDGKPATDIDVTVELRMPPAGAMGEMRTGAELKPVGDGHFRGQVDMTMAGQWNAIVRVKRGGQIVAMHSQPVTAE